MQILLVLAAALVGAVLGLRFTVFVLLPAVASALAIALAIGVMQHVGAWSIAATAAMVTVALQLGYLGGTAAGHFLVPAVRGLLREQ
jgi:CBS-domain-containing membrane protein